MTMISSTMAAPSSGRAALPAAAPAAGASAPLAAAPAVNPLPPFAQWLGRAGQGGEGALVAVDGTASGEPADSDGQAGALPDGGERAPEAMPHDGGLAAMAMAMPMMAMLPPAAPVSLAEIGRANAALPSLPTVPGATPAWFGAGAAAPALSAAGAPLAAPVAAATPVAAAAADTTAAPGASGSSAELAPAPAARAWSPPSAANLASLAANEPGADPRGAVPAAPGRSSDKVLAHAATAEAPPASAERAATPVNGWGVGALAPVATQGAAGDSIKLAGAPPQWQQPLREALGERLQVHLDRNSEQALIRLDPPMLGRIEISIRHTAGALQVFLSASHGEVLRQLHTISDSMQHDLAQRQYTEVAVSVTATPRSPAAAPFGEHQGRQRQPGREPEEADPGRALSEAGQPSSSFSMNE
jgi:flagellar hook-length control protein FliK